MSISIWFFSINNMLYNSHQNEELREPVILLYHWFLFIINLLAFFCFFLLFFVLIGRVLRYVYKQNWNRSCSDSEVWAIITDMLVSWAENNGYSGCPRYMYQVYQNSYLLNLIVNVKLSILTLFASCEFIVKFLWAVTKGYKSGDRYCACNKHAIMVIKFLF